MKVNNEKKVIEQVITTYISDDGKVFSNEKQCKDYEKSLKSKELEERLNLIKQTNCVPPHADSDHNYVWFYITNKEDINTIENYYNGLNDYNDVEIEVKSFPSWYGIEEGYEDEAWTLGTLDEYKTNVNKMLEYIEK
jgi:hypothetical protein